MAGYRFAICNEVFQQAPFDRAIAQIQALGYDGVELAPFTLSDDPASLSAAQRRDIRRTIEDAGLSLVGLHWLLIRPAGLHMTTPDTSVRRRTWDYVHRLIELCAHSPTFAASRSYLASSCEGLRAESAANVSRLTINRRPQLSAGCRAFAPRLGWPDRR